MFLLEVNLTPAASSRRAYIVPSSLSTSNSFVTTRADGRPERSVCIRGAKSGSVRSGVRKSYSKKCHQILFTFNAYRKLIYRLSFLQCLCAVVSKCVGEQRVVHVLKKGRLVSIVRTHFYGIACITCSRCFLSS